jgi:hypothetical protein
VGGLSSVGSEVESFATALREAQYGVTELARELRHYVDHVSVDPGRLTAVDERLRLYTDLARKYGGSTEAAITHLEASTLRLATLEQGEEDLSRLEEEAAAGRAPCGGAGRLALLRPERQAVPALEEAVAPSSTEHDLGGDDRRLDTRPGWEGLRETGADWSVSAGGESGQPPRSWLAPLGRELSGPAGFKCAGRRGR